MHEPNTVSFNKNIDYVEEYLAPWISERNATTPRGTLERFRRRLAVRRERIERWERDARDADESSGSTPGEVV